MTRGLHLAKTGDPQVGHSPRPPGKASCRSEFTSAYCKLEPQVVLRVGGDQGLGLLKLGHPKTNLYLTSHEFYTVEY